MGKYLSKETVVFATHFCGFMVLYVYMSIGKDGWSSKCLSGNSVNCGKTDNETSFQMNT